MLNNAAGLRLDGKTALITGASKGLGKAMALSLSEAGATIALVSRDEQKLAAVKSEIEQVRRKSNRLCCRCEIRGRGITAGIENFGPAG